MALDSSRSARSPGRVLGAALLTALLGGAAVGIGLGARIAMLNGWGAGSDLLLLTAYLSGLYGLVFAVGLGAVALGLLAVGGRPGPRVFLAVLVGFSVFLSGALRFNPAIQLFSVVPSMNAVGVIDLILVGIVSLAAMGAILSTARTRVGGFAAIGLAVLAGLHAFHVRHERPHLRDLASELPPLLTDAGSPPAAWDGKSFENARLIVLGFDGLSWDVLVPLLQRGELPNIQTLLVDSAYGYLDTLDFPISPVVWETIFTGQPPSRHGIGHHVHYAFPGMTERVRHLPYFPLANTPMGLRRLLAATKRVAPWSTLPASSVDARVARFWEIASSAGLTVGSYSFTNTTPAPPLNGFLHGYGVDPPVDFPPDLMKGLPPLAANEPEAGASGGKPAAPSTLGDWERFVALARRSQPELLMYYTHFADAVTHLNWKSEAVGDGLFYLGLMHPDFDPGPAISAANRVLDQIVGDLLPRLRPDAVVALISDHGFDFRGYEHDNSPPGVIVLKGVGIRPGLISGASVFDVTPTLVQLLGLPGAKDMDGRVLPVAAAGGPFDAPIERIASYGAATQPPAGEAVDPERVEEYEKYLRSLGYVVD